MRFGISATSLIDPKNFLTRLRPVNVCAIGSILSRFEFAGSAGASPDSRHHRDYPDRRRGCPFLCDSGLPEPPHSSTRLGGNPSLGAAFLNLSRATGPGIAICLQISVAYFNSTLAPTFSRVALILSASSLLTPSLTGLGAPSTRSLASFRPRPVSARTSLITSIFLSPAAARTTVNSVFSSAAAAPPPAGPAATATAAAAETPHF